MKTSHHTYHVGPLVFTWIDNVPGNVDPEQPKYRFERYWKINVIKTNEYLGKIQFFENGKKFFEPWSGQVINLRLTVPIMKALLDFIK